MKAHWIFFNAVVNDHFYLTDLYAFPIQLPPVYNQQIMDMIDGFDAMSFCMQQAKLFELTDILLKAGHPIRAENQEYLQLKSYISRHLDDPLALTPARLSAYMKTSESSFYRKFKNLFGVSSVAYIRNERLDQAAFLLETTDLSIGSISEKTGFYDNSQFDLFFKKKFGDSPSVFRKKVKRANDPSHD